MSDLEKAIRAIVEQAIEERLGGSPSAGSMVAKYGEMVGRGKAAEMLNVSAATITAMCKDGRLSGTPLGVSVRSIAKYLDDGRPTAQAVKRRARAKEYAFQRCIP